MTAINRTNEEKYINKIILLGSSVVIIIVSLIIGYILISSEIKNFQNHLKTFKSTLFEREKHAIKTTVENLLQDIIYEKNLNISKVKMNIKNQTTLGYNLAKAMYEQNRFKNKDDIIKIIKRSIKSMVKDEKEINYFLLSREGTLLLNTLSTKNENKNFIYFVDIYGKKFIKDIINSTSEKNSFVDYMWYKPSSSKIAKKIVYARMIKELDLVIGSGNYLDSNLFLSDSMVDKIKNQYLNTDEFIYIYELKNLNHPREFSRLILEKNIQTSDKELEVMNQILIDTDYGANSFFEYDNKLIYSTFLQGIKTYISVGINMNTINKIIENETILSNKNLNKKVLSLGVSILFVVFIFFVLSYFVSKKIEIIFKNYRLKVMRNERNYQLLFNHSNDAFIISKLETNKAPIRSSNEVAKKLSGYGFDLLGIDFYELISGLDIVKLTNEREILARVKLKRHDGKMREIELNSIIYEDKDETLLFSSLRDITERINLKKEKDKQQQLLIQKSKMASMGEMIGNIAHQWRQPLTQLSGLFFDIESAYDYKELNKKYLSSRIDEANDLVEYMSTTIDDFKNFYKPNTNNEKFNLNENIQNVLNMIESSIKFHSIAIHTDIDHALHVEGFSNEFSQVIINILSNAKEIALERGIKEPKINIFSEAIEDDIFLHVEDNCGGVEPEIIDKIFEPYFTTKYHYGTGIGLYMSKVIIEDKMGGKIFVQNRDENICRFTIVLGDR